MMADKTGNQRCRHPIGIKPQTGMKRHTGKGEHGREDIFTHQNKTGQKQHGKRQGQPVIKNQQCAKGVAIRLPPQKRRLTGQMWPATTASMARAVR